MRLLTLAGQSPTDKFLDDLRKAYGGLEGKLTVLDLDANRIRAEYRFDNKKEARDFLPDLANTWGITANGVLAAQSQRATQTECKLVFDTTKPLKLSFQASGPGDLDAMLMLGLRLPFQQGGVPILLALGAAGNTSGIINGPGARPYINPQMQVKPGTVYREQIDWDGQGKVGWTINGTKITEWAAQPAPTLKYLRVAFQVLGGPTGYDDITIEGTVITDPESARVGGPDRPGRPRWWWRWRRRRRRIVPRSYRVP